MESFKITTDCSIFDRFCFLCVVCLFWWFYGFLWRVFAMEKLKYSRYNTITKYELVYYRTYSSDLFSYTNGSHEGFCWVLCDWSFQVLGYLMMDVGIRSKKSLSLGMPRMASPLSSSFISNFTWSYIFIHHMICVLIGASCMILVFAF